MYPVLSYRTELTEQKSMTDLTKKTSSAWRSFMGSEEGIAGLQWILSNRPPLDAEHWQMACGFEAFQKRINEVLENGAIRADREDPEDKLRL